MKVSIITVCKNRKDVIEVAVKSVLKQTWGNREYIIIDGGSTDGTLEIVEKYRNGIDIVVSEEDLGIYHAMNKGIRLAKGDIVYFLNSDDSLYDQDVLSDIVRRFRMGNPVAVYGNILLVDSVNEDVIKYDHVDRHFFLHNTICHQAIFARKALFQEIGLYDIRYTVYADVDWLIKAFLKYSSSFRYYDRMICRYACTGISAEAFYDKTYVRERLQILSKYFWRSRLSLSLKKALGLITL
ncbi:MAG: glycosyltransferase [Deltaproteobacteria bacterium]|nr:glycosyltransferase [Deltaproteobacteria bacterium]